MSKQESRITQDSQSESDGSARVLAGFFLGSIACLALVGSLARIIQCKTTYTSLDLRFLLVFIPFGLLMLALSIGFFRKSADSNHPLLPSWAILTTGVWMVVLGVVIVVGMITDQIHLSGVMSGRGLGVLFSFGFLFILFGRQRLVRKKK